MADCGYRVSLDIRVHSPGTLYDAALRHALMVDGLTVDEANDLLLDCDGEPMADECLRMMLDPGSIPGCEVQGHEAECTWSHAPEDDTELEAARDES